MLAPREREVLRLAARGLTTPEIAEQMGIARPTVKTYQDAIRKKLGARSITHAVAIARWEDLLEDGEPVPAST